MKLYKECEHLIAFTTCDVRCEAYVRGDGMVEVEPCEHGNYAPHMELEKFNSLMWCDGKPKEDTGYPKGAVTRAAELAAEYADPELHHHEVSHSHPFENLDHTHDQPKLDEQEKEDEKCGWEQQKEDDNDE